MASTSILYFQDDPNNTQIFQKGIFGGAALLGAKYSNNQNQAY